MNNIIDFWKIEEIKNLEKLIKEKEYLIKQYDLELVEIHKTRKPTLKDFGILNYKYGNKNLNKDIINIYILRLDFLRDNNNSISKEQYYRIGILL